MIRYDKPMILLDGKKLAERVLSELKDEIAALPKQPRLGVVVVGNDPVTASFVEQKKKAARAAGIDVRVYPFPETVTTNELRKQIAIIVHEKKNSGVIIQLPLPEHINKQYILNAIPPEKDADVLSARALGNFVVGKSKIMPPVIGAVKLLLDEYAISYHGKQIVIVGAGSLVGRPSALWLLQEGVLFSVLTDEAKQPEDLLTRADIVITGVGKPGLIKGDMLKEGAVVFDAGTSESQGRVVGDADYDSVSVKAAYLTPVPGGIGPLTVAVLFRNLLTLARDKKT